MTETKFTPGPWVAHDYRVFKLRADGLYDRHIAWTAGNAKQRTTQALANAVLSAAAPELYEAGQRLKQIHDDLAARIERGEDTGNAFDLWDGAMDDMEVALRKARGESQ